MEKTSKDSAPSGQKSIQEIKEFDMQFQRRQELFASTKSAIQFLDLTKSESRTFSTFSREKLKSYMTNPKANENNLRDLSKFLYRLSHPYRRLIGYNAEMLDLSAMTIIPDNELVQAGNTEAALQSFIETAVIVDKMDLKEEIYKCALIAWREDAFFGYTYFDENDGLYIMPLDARYCKISSTNYDGTFNMAFDFSYFRAHAECLGYWDKEFNQKYNKYQTDNNLRWQELDPAKTMVLKVNTDDPTMCVPPYLALFSQILDLVELAEIQKTRDELSAYMLLVAKLKHLQGSTEPDDFDVDINTAIAYFNKLDEALPPCVDAVLSPVEIDAITFKDHNTTETNDMLSRSMENIFATSGGYQVLGNKQSGQAIFSAQILSDTLNALKPLLWQIEHWHNRFLTYVMSEHAKVKYLMCSPYTKNDYKKSLMESAQYGVPVKMAVAALDGFSPLEVLGAQFLENDCLSLHSTWIPLQSSHTSSGAPVEGTDPVKGGAPKKDATDLTDEGAETRDQGKNLK